MRFLCKNAFFLRKNLVRMKKSITFVAENK